MTVFWSLSEMIYEHHIAKLIYSIVAYGIIITIGGVAYQNGFDTYD
jgi:hypothetical protein